MEFIDKSQPNAISALIMKLIALPHEVYQLLGGRRKRLGYGFSKYYTNIFPQEWNDYNLAWNTSEYGNIDNVRIDPRRIWTPDLLMYNR